MTRHLIILALVVASIDTRPVDSSTQVGNPVGRAILEGCNPHHDEPRSAPTGRR